MALSEKQILIQIKYQIKNMMYLAKMVKTRLKC